MDYVHYCLRVFVCFVLACNYFIDLLTNPDQLLSTGQFLRQAAGMFYYVTCWVLKHFYLDFFSHF